ncbi:MAG: AraC family transcriptional regulator [Myxococcota bacterium]
MLESIRSRVDAAFQRKPHETSTIDCSAHLFFLRSCRRSPVASLFYEPALCLVLQGAKETTCGERTLRLTAGDSVIISHHVPVYARTLNASKKLPYYALIVRLDLSLIRSLCVELERSAHRRDAFAVDRGASDEPLLRTLDRMIEASVDPVEADLLGDGLRKELHLRLLRASHGEMLRRLQPVDSDESKVARAIGYIRRNYRNGLSVSEVAQAVAMSDSSFYQKFKTVTGTTPLQYQKTLRLTEAKDLLTAEKVPVSDAAFAVGYESPSHFSRDYKRHFGLSPKETRMQIVG